MTNKERREAAYLIQLAADLATHRAKLDPTWPDWRKRLFWEEIDPQIKDFHARAKELTGVYCSI